MSETTEITRYPNRRLYDRSQKKYVTLGDIESLVLSGSSVRVRDSKSDEDLTRLILTQILLERHPERLRMFPVAFLHAILRANHLALDWLTAYFGQAMSYLERISSTSSPPFAPGMDLWRSFLPGGSETATRADEAGQPPAATGDAATGDLEQAGREQPTPGGNEADLAARLAEMEKRLKLLEKEQPQ